MGLFILVVVCMILGLCHKKNKTTLDMSKNYTQNELRKKFHKTTKMSVFHGFKVEVVVEVVLSTSVTNLKITLKTSEIQKILSLSRLI